MGEINTLGIALVNILGACLIVTSICVIIARSAAKSAYIYALQSIILVALLITLGWTTGSTELYTWGCTAFATKVILVPAVLLFTISKAQKYVQVDHDSRMSIRKIVIFAAIELIVCFVAVGGISLESVAQFKPTMAIALAHFFIGLTCIVAQRSVVKQIFGYCLMENGSHVMLALLAPEAPALVEIGVATDAIFAVIIMAVMVVRLSKYAKTLNADDLCELKG